MTAGAADPDGHLASCPDCRVLVLVRRSLASLAAAPRGASAPAARIVFRKAELRARWARDDEETERATAVLRRVDLAVSIVLALASLSIVWMAGGLWSLLAATPGLLLLCAGLLARAQGQYSRASRSL